MRTKLVTVTVVGLLAAMLPATAEAGAPLNCPGLVEVEGGWLLTEDAACNLRLPGAGATFDLGGHTLTGGVSAGARQQTVRNGTIVITDHQGWYSFTLSHVTVRPLVPGDCLAGASTPVGLTIEHSTFRDIGGAALNFYNGGDATIRHSTFIGNGAAIVVDLGSDVRMENNWFIDNQVAVSLNTHDGDGVHRNTIRNNVFWHNGSGLSMSHNGERGGLGPVRQHGPGQLVRGERAVGSLHPGVVHRRALARVHPPVRQRHRGEQSSGATGSSRPPHLLGTTASPPVASGTTPMGRHPATSPKRWPGSPSPGTSPYSTPTSASTSPAWSTAAATRPDSTAIEPNARAWPAGAAGNPTT